MRGGGGVPGIPLGSKAVAPNVSSFYRKIIGLLPRGLGQYWIYPDVNGRKRVIYVTVMNSLYRLKEMKTLIQVVSDTIYH